MESKAKNVMKGQEKWTEMVIWCNKWSFGAQKLTINLDFSDNNNKYPLPEMRKRMDIIICDDSQRDREILTGLLRDYERKNGQHFEITEYGSGDRLCQDEKALQKCQLIFMDINMTDMDGLEAAGEIRSRYPKLPIVLVTAYMNYALEGYKVKASRFLLKDDLAETIDECMDDLMGEIRKNSRVLEFPFVEGKIRLHADDIIYIETARHKNIFYTEKAVYSIYRKLDEIEAELKDMGFVRIHLSFLVNMRYIAKISSYVLTLANGKEISVPKSRYQEVKRKYALFKGEEP